MANELLNLLARALLRATTPTRTHAVLLGVGRFFPTLWTHAELKAAAENMLNTGTCLTRALALAARAPRADVVIGVQPRGREPLHAHAWVELDGEPLHPEDPSGEEIARFRGRLSPSRKGADCVQ